MGFSCRWAFLCCCLAIALFWGCSSDSGNELVVGPVDYPDGQGSYYLVDDVLIASATPELPVGAIYVRSSDAQGDLPVVILLHDFLQNNQQWFFSTFLLDLLAENYSVLALNLRGHGNSPLSDNRDQLEIGVEDLEASYLDVQTALDWLGNESGVDADRIAVIGAGFGANVAYVSRGVFPSRIQTAVGISPLFWPSIEDNTLPILVGAGIVSFEPQKMLFMVGEIDVFLFQGSSIHSSLDFVNQLAAGAPDSEVEAVTATLEGPLVYGVTMLCNPEQPDCNPEPRSRLLNWLEDNL